MAVTQADLDALVVLGGQYTDAIRALAPDDRRLDNLVRAMSLLQRVLVMYLQRLASQGDAGTPTGSAPMATDTAADLHQLRVLLDALEQDGADPTTP